MQIGINSMREGTKKKWYEEFGGRFQNVEGCREFGKTLMRAMTAMAIKKDQERPPR